jgi:16S rRNA processing protein RimM
MKKDDCFHLGKITQPHGIKGEVKVWLDVDVPQEYEKLESVFLEMKGQLIPHFIEEIQIRGKKSIARFEDMKTWEDTQKILGCEMYLPLSALPKLKSDQYYYHEIVGYEVVDAATKKVYSTVDAVYESTGQDLLAMTMEEKEILIPINDDIVVGIDKENKQLFVSLPAGLLEVYLEG